MAKICKNPESAVMYKFSTFDGSGSTTSRHKMTTWLPRHGLAGAESALQFLWDPPKAAIHQGTLWWQSGDFFWGWDDGSEICPPWDVVIHSSIRWMLMLLRWPLWMMWDPWWSRWLLIWLVAVAEWLQDGPEGPGGMSIICLKHHGKRWGVSVFCW